MVLSEPPDLSALVRCDDCETHACTSRKEVMNVPRVTILNRSNCSRRTKRELPKSGRWYRTEKRARNSHCIQEIVIHILMAEAFQV